MSDHDFSDESTSPGARAQRVLEAADTLTKPDVRDVDPNEWLSQPQEMEGTVEVDGVRLKIAAMTEAEVQNLMKQNTRPNPARPMEPARLDAMRFRLALISASLNKAGANPNITPNQLEGRKTGSLTTIQEAIMDLSGMATGPQPSASFFA